MVVFSQYTMVLDIEREIREKEEHRENTREKIVRFVVVLSLVAFASLCCCLHFRARQSQLSSISGQAREPGKARPSA